MKVIWGGRVNNNGPRTIRLNTIKDENWVANIDIRSGNYSGLGTLAQDSVSAVTIYLPTDLAEGIYNNVYYTTDLRNIVNEVNIQRTNAVNILNNRDKYEAIVTECDNIYHTIEGMLTPQQQPAPAYKQEEFEAFKTEVAEKLSMQQDILMKIASELGLNKNNNAKQKG